jgi:DNA-binding MarR family transcriptional regulator
VGRIYGLTSAERRCLSFVSLEAQTASAIATETALTPAAELIDRLEDRGLVRRSGGAEDRRKVFVEATTKTRELVRNTYAPIAQAGAEMLACYSIDELTTVRRRGCACAATADDCCAR